MITCLRTWPLVLVSFAGAIGCQDYLFEQKFPEKVKEATIIRPAAKPTPADILFVVDNSGSMADEQENLARNFDAFIEQIAGAGDYQIAVVTTDQLADTSEQQGLLISTFAQSAPNDLISLDNGSCTELGIPHGCFRGPDAGKRIISSTLIPDRAGQIAAFQANARVGSCGSGEEQGLKSMIAALENARQGGCNDGFLRDEANLVVVILSDENDTDATPIDQYVADMVRFKPYSKTRIAMIIGSVDGDGKNCRIPNSDQCGSLCQSPPPEGSHGNCTVGGAASQCPQGEFCERIMVGNTAGRCENSQRRNFNSTNCLWCSFYNTSDCCSALNGQRYVDFARRMETRINADVPSIPIQQCRGTMEGQPVACLVDSICQDNFSATLERIARELIVTNDFVLEPPAINPAGVVVRVKNGRFPVEGKQLEYGTDFVVVDNGRRLQIMGENTPREGEDIEIYFVVEVEHQ